jgi:hypothetical protein
MLQYEPSHRNSIIADLISLIHRPFASRKKSAVVNVSRHELTHQLRVATKCTICERHYAFAVGYYVSAANIQNCFKRKDPELKQHA